MSFKKVFKLSPDTRHDVIQKALRAWFDDMDKDKNGWLSKQELRQVLSMTLNDLNIRRRINERDIQKAFNALDVNKDGKVDFGEFAKFAFEVIGDGADEIDVVDKS